MATQQATTRMTQQQLRERAAAATVRLREALQLPNNLGDSTVLGAAVADAVATEARRNPALRQEIRRIYDELASLQGARTRRAPQRQETLEPLVPIRHTSGPIDPFAAPDPKVLAYVYGSDKVGRALKEYSLDKLKLAADETQQRHPGTKPKSRASKQSVIDYIMKYADL